MSFMCYFRKICSNIQLQSLIHFIFLVKKKEQKFPSLSTQYTVYECTQHSIWRLRYWMHSLDCSYTSLDLNGTVSLPLHVNHFLARINDGYLLPLGGCDVNKNLAAATIMTELGLEILRSSRSAFTARNASPDSVIFSIRSNFSVFSSTSDSVDRCSFASDAQDHDSEGSPVLYKLCKTLAFG